MYLVRLGRGLANRKKTPGVLRGAIYGASALISAFSLGLTANALSGSTALSGTLSCSVALVGTVSGSSNLTGNLAGAITSDIMVIMYGQSNMVIMTSTSASPPAAVAGTRYFDGSSFVAVPGGNGVREILNGIKTATGRDCDALNGAISGVTIEALSKGSPNTYFSSLASKINAAGRANTYVIVFNQGEGDSADGTTKATYLARLDTLHQDICDVVGMTKAQVPLFVSGLGNVVNGVGYGTHASWDNIQRALIDSAALPNTFYSHSNRDRVTTDDVHGDGASCGRSGKRFARSITTYLGATSGEPHWAVSSSAVIDATTTTVDVTHSLGTDFTPTTGITGFEVSGDNGGSWEAATGVRTSPTRITLTHSSLSTSSLRKLRYQFGKNPDVSGIVRDNSPLAIPLDNSAGVISPTPLAALPTPAYKQRATTSTSNATQPASNLDIGTAYATRMVIVGINGAATPSSVTITPNGGSAITMTIATSQGANAAQSSIWYAIVPTGTLATVQINYTYNPYDGSGIAVYTLDSAALLSTTPVDAKSVGNSNANTLTTNLTTVSGGFVIAVAASRNVSANSATWVGINERYDLAASAVITTGGEMSGTPNATNAYTVTPTFVNSANITLSAASWR